jgi:hypothetical protein
MAEKIDSKVTSFLLGLGVGSLIGILDVIERGKEVVSQEKEKIAAAVEEGRETYQREKSKAKGA